MTGLSLVVAMFVLGAVFGACFVVAFDWLLPRTRRRTPEPLDFSRRSL